MSAPAAAAIAQRLDRRRVYLLPSRAGLTLGVMLVVILLGAINYDNALGYLLSFLLGGLVMVAMLHGYRNLAGLGFGEARARPVFVGQHASFECVLANPSPRARLRLYLKHWPRGRTRAERRYLSQFETVFDLGPDEAACVVVPVEARRRGWLALERVVLHTHYPLGILRAWAYFDSGARCLVYPLPRGTRALPRARAAGHGAAASTATGVDDFAGLRPYTPGDAARAIAWKSLAKEQDLMVKRFHGQTAARLWLSWAEVIDLGPVEARLSQLAAWVLEAHRGGLTYGLEIPGATVPLGQGSRHRDACLRALALYESPA